jgi:4'-phosphopantetheinyl transferase
MSHSRDLAVYVLADSQRVGIDIEALEAHWQTNELPEECFTSRELRAIRKLHGSSQASGALEVWTRKEAYLKALEMGLQRELQSIEVTVPPSPPGLVYCECNSAPGNWQLVELNPFPGFVGTVCIENI